MEQANKIIDLNFHLGIGGVVTFKNGGIDKFLNQIPLTSIVLETDAPYLIPRNLKPRPSKNINLPKYLPHIAAEISSLTNYSIDEIATETYNNAIKFFNLT